jgi:hypothetical protein
MQSAQVEQIVRAVSAAVPLQAQFFDFPFDAFERRAQTQMRDFRIPRKRELRDVSRAHAHVRATAFRLSKAERVFVYVFG